MGEDFIEFQVFGEPKGKGRPRFTRFGQTYTPKDTADYEKLIKAEYLSQCDVKPTYALQALPLPLR